MSNNIDELSVRKAVKKRYSELAKGRSPCCSGNDYTQYIGYSLEEVSKLPEDVVEVGAGCGNPTAIAGLKPGQTVLDLGSGGGIDVFLAAQAVGPKGKAIGVDATPEMIWRARKAAKDMNAANVEFRLGEIECLPVESNTVDIIISNCVINLSPDKEKVFGEALRVLRPGGKLVISDMVLTEGIAPGEREKLTSWASCIGGAITLEEYVGKMAAAGFKDINIESKHVYTMEELAYMLSEPSGCGCGCGTLGLKSLSDSRALSKVASVRIEARKP